MSDDPKRRVAFSAQALAALLSGTHIALAASATWLSTGTNGGWHDAANWTPATVPNGAADVATFGTTDQLIPFALLTANTEVNGIVFNPGAPSWSIGGENVTFTISGTGITNNSGAIDVLTATGASGALRFQNSATAGNANVAIIGQNGGTVLFTGSSTGGSARLFAQSTGAVDISGLTTSGMTAGLIITDNTGSNFFRLGSKTLTVGGANLDSTVSGVITDGGTAGGVGGSIVKVGTGTMTYAGFSANTYTGTTFVNEGTLVLNKSVEAIRGPLVVGDASGAAASAVLQCIGANEIINDSQSLTVNGDGRFELGAAVRETIGALTVNTGNVRLFILTRLAANGPLVMTGGTIEAPSGPGNPGMIFLRNLTIQATSASDGSAATVSAPVRLDNSFPFTFTVSDGPGATDLLISGTVTADLTATIVKAGAGVMVLSGNNTYVGPTTINGGTLSISSDANLGTPPALPTANHLVFDGGTLRATANFTLNAKRGLALNVGGGAVEVTSGNTVDFAGVVAGAGGLTKTGPGALVFTGASGSTHTGTTTVNDGVLELGKSTANQAIIGPLMIGDGLGAASSAVVRSGGSQISDSAPVTIQPDGRLDIGIGTGDQIGSLTMAGGNVQVDIAGLRVSGALAMTGGTIVGSTTTLFGNVTASSDASGLAATINSIVSLGGGTRTFTVNDGPGALDLHVSAPITNGGITKTGAGTLALGDANMYNGPTTVIAGKLVLTGSLSNSTTVVANGATLQGTGTTTGPLTINAGATLVPGLSVGTLTTGDLTLNAGSTVAFELAVANVAGAGLNDLIAVNGSLAFGGTLAITTLPGFGPGAYPLFTYTNTATNLGLAFESSFLAAHPGSTIELDTINKRVVANITASPFLPGDYNQNGTVDAADYVVWRNGLGTTHTQNDYNVWRANFGRTAASGSGATGSASASAESLSTAVPEPASLVLVFLAAVVLIVVPRGRLVAKNRC